MYSVFCCFGKTISRILYPLSRAVIICLPIRLLSGSSELLLTEIQDEINPNFCFVLALSKDLAVSPQHCCWIIPKPGCSTFRSRRRCSHLIRPQLRSCRRRRLLAATFLSRLRRESVRTFLPPKTRGAITHLVETILYYQF